MFDTQQKTILLVEDEPLIALTERITLETAGYHVTVATTGEAAVAAIVAPGQERSVPDLILMDIDLGPGMDGTEAARRILEVQDLPVVFLSSHTEPEIVARTEEIGSYGYIVKNSGETVLLASIRMAFQLKDAHRKLERINRKSPAEAHHHDHAHLQGQQQQFLANLFEQVPGAIYQYQSFPDGRSCFPVASRNIWQVYELTPEEVAEDATPVFRRIHPDDLEAVVTSIQHSRDTLEIWEQDYRVLLPSRGERWLRGRATPRLVEDGSVIWHGYITDITQHRVMQEEIADERRRLVSILDGTNVGTWEWNVQTGETCFNERWAGIIGYTLEEISPVSIKTWQQFSHPEDLRRSEAALTAHFSGSTEFYEFRGRMRHRDGHWVWILDRGKITARTAAGEPEWVFGTHQDISQSIAYQERLRQSEENFRTFFDTSRDFLWVLNGAGEILDVNNTVLERLEYTKEELLGKSVLTVHPVHRREEAGQIVGEMLAGKRGSCPVPVVTKGGHQIPVETTVAPATWDGKDALFGVSRDISALALSEEKYARMSNSSPAVIGLSDSLTGEYVEVNDAFCKLFSYSRDEILGKRSLDLIGLDPQFRGAISREMDQNGIFRNVETTVHTKDGQSIDLLLFGARIDVQERSYNLITAIDIRERKKAERALQEALSAKQTLMAELNHRVKNNLALLASLIRLKNSEIGSAADLSDLESRVQAIASLHEELQRSAKLDRVAQRPYLERVLATVFGSARPPVGLELEIPIEEVPTRHATTIGLILNELATNAIKYGFPGEKEPHFTVSQTDDGSLTTMVVTNNGNAFPEHLSLDNPTTLGLRLISALVKQLGGTIALERSPRTTFTLRYPLARIS